MQEILKLTEYCQQQLQRNPTAFQVTQKSFLRIGV